MMPAIEFHQLANLFPLMRGDEFSSFVLDIKDNGLREPVCLYDGKILDGRNRYRACRELGFDPEFVSFAGDCPLRFVISKNLQRRHLRDSQRAFIAAQISRLPRGRRPIGCVALSAGEAADLLQVRRSTLDRARVVDRLGIDELKAAVANGVCPVSTAESISRMSPAQQREAVDRGDFSATRARRFAIARGQKRRREYLSLWRQIDVICDALGRSRLDLAEQGAISLRAEIVRVVRGAS
jgi:hypothetical protein